MTESSVKAATSILVWEGHPSAQFTLCWHTSPYAEMPLAPCSFLRMVNLSRGILTDWLRQIFSTAGIEGNFSSHSFRIGAATVAARNGIPDHLIQALGRWTTMHTNFIFARLRKLLRASLVSWLDIVCPCRWLFPAPSTLRSSLAPNCSGLALQFLALLSLSAAFIW